MSLAKRPMVRLLHADGFFPAGDVERCVSVVEGMRFQQKEYGYELDNFNMVLSGLEPILSIVLGERVAIDHKRSGIFRRPFNNVIHYERFDSLNEWCFIVALEKTTLNLYHHKSPKGIDAETALHGQNFNYKNLFEWDLHTNILLEPNQGVFIRPWVFHSLDPALVQYYRLVTDDNFRILVMGKNSASRQKVSNALGDRIEKSTILCSKDIRIKSKDLDYSIPGTMRNTNRVLVEARNNTKDGAVIIDMAAPYEDQRKILNCDLVFWIDDDNFEQLEPPQVYDGRYTTISSDSIDDMVRRIKTKRVHI